MRKLTEIRFHPQFDALGHHVGFSPISHPDNPIIIEALKRGYLVLPKQTKNRNTWPSLKNRWFEECRVKDIAYIFVEPHGKETKIEYDLIGQTFELTEEGTKQVLTLFTRHSMNRGWSYSVGKEYGFVKLKTTAYKETTQDLYMILRKNREARHWPPIRPPAGVIYAFESLSTKPPLTEKEADRDG
jgi:hypothetical protein